jgi:L-amino acid N-acyltransferase YncA
MATSKKAIIRPATPSDMPTITKINEHYTLNTVITFKTEVTTCEQHVANLEKVRSQKLPYLVAVSAPTPESTPAPSSTEIKAEETSTSESKVIGYAYVSGFRSSSGKASYIHTVELSIFLDPSHVYGGTGTLLLKTLISVISNPSEYSEYYPNGIRGDDVKVRQVIACMALDVDGKENGLGLKRWYEGFGFVFSGHLKEVGFKFGRWYGLSSPLSNSISPVDIQLTLVSLGLTRCICN